MNSDPQSTLESPIGFFRRSLRARFAAASVPVILVLIIGIYFAFDAQLEKIVSDLSHRFAIQQVTYDRWRTVQPLLQEIALARNLARSQSVIEWATNQSDPEKHRRGLTELETTRRIFRDQSYFFAIDASGDYFFNDAQNSYEGRQYRYTLSPTKTDDAWYYATKENPEECQLNVNNDTELKVTKVWINCLVRQGEKVVGVIGTGLDLTGFISSVLESRQPGVLNMFIDGDGAIQAHPDAAAIDFHTLTKTAAAKKTVYQLLTDEQGRSALDERLKRLRGKPDTVDTLSLKIGDEKKLVGITYISEINWFNLTVISPRVWSLGQNFIPLIVLTGAGVLLTLIFGAFILHRLVLSRIGRLDRAVAAIKENSYTHDFSDPVHDEIGRLGDSLNSMAKAVARNRHMLEEEVLDRTRKLEVARDEAEAASAAKSKFLANMSHELKTPLNAIIGFSTLLSENQLGLQMDARYRDYSRDIRDAGNYLNSLISDILDLSKIESGRYEIAPEMVSASDLAEQANILTLNKAQSRNISVLMEVIPKDLSLWVDRRALLQVVINLLSNAIKFSPEHSKIHFCVEALEDGRISITVSDTGVGIDAKEKGILFDPFVRGQTATRNHIEGTGLGLAISKRLVELHQGEIHLSNRDGGGTVAQVRLPPTCKAM